jgi:hypothetical protein
MYTPPPVPIGACESKTTMPTSGRAAMLRECLAPGLETQTNSRWSAWAKYTGDAHGRPVSSAVPRVM